MPGLAAFAKASAAERTRGPAKPRRRGLVAARKTWMAGWMAGHRRAEATPSFGRLCPAMTIPAISIDYATSLNVAGITLLADLSGALFWNEQRLLVVSDLHLEKG